jgi:M6 family metalloprotease-like protein
MKLQISVSLSLALVIAASVAQSALLRNYPQTLVQPDGTVIHCYASGDEYRHWLHDARNYTIMQDQQTGYYVYAATQNGLPLPTSGIVGRVDPEAVGLVPGVNVGAGIKRFGPHAGLAKAAGASNLRSVGAINNIVIFIRFAGEAPNVIPDSIARFDRMFNSAVPGTSSMYMYYREASYNQLAISSTFYPLAIDSVLSYEDSYPRAYYRKYNASTNPQGYSSDDQAWSRETAMLVRAVKAVASQVPAGLTIDANGDGFVDNVCFIVSGDVEGWADLLWPHMSWLGYANVAIRGKIVGNFNLQLRNDLVDSQNMVYVLSHEMFHSLGAPDLYHYSGDGPDPVGTWDIMDYSFNPPVHMSAYMKWKYGGWISAIPEITAPGTYTLSTLRSATNNCFKIRSSFSPREFFVVEYRKRGGTFEKTLPGEGLLVYRVNPDYEGNADGPPDELYLYRPGGTLTAEGSLSKAGMSSNSGRVTFSDTTSPSCFLSDGSRGGLLLRSVGALGTDSIRFTVEFPKFPIISLSTQAISFDPMSDAVQQIDTAIVVRNTGLALDSLTASIDYANIVADSAIAVSPRAFTLDPGDSQSVAITLRSRFIASGYHTPSIVITSKFSMGQKTYITMLNVQRTVTGVAETSGQPVTFGLQQNYPNPFNAGTIIGYGVSGAGGRDVRLAVYDVLGREVALLVNEKKAPGNYEVQFDASGLASGMLFYRLTTDGFIQTRKMQLLK